MAFKAEHGMLISIAIGVAISLYFATQNDGEEHVPQVQGEAQFGGIANFSASAQYAPGTMLDMTPDIHFWSPGYNPRDSRSPQPTVQCQHRYPVVPGGNISGIMHNGWASSQPAENDWYLNPPEVAVL